jgi:hypothetical protein
LEKVPELVLSIAYLFSDMFEQEQEPSIAGIAAPGCRLSPGAGGSPRLTWLPSLSLSRRESYTSPSQGFLDFLNSASCKKVCFTSMFLEEEENFVHHTFLYIFMWTVKH